MNDVTQREKGWGIYAYVTLSLNKIGILLWKRGEGVHKFGVTSFKTFDDIYKFSFYFYFLGDEIFSINSVPVQGMTHQEAIGLFKEVKKGPIVVTIGRRASTGGLSKPVSTNHLASTTEIEE